MYKIEKLGDGAAETCTPNVLPCRINHNGQVDASRRYWDMKRNPDGKPTTHFRGRKLHARSIAIPETHRGVVLQPTEKLLPHTRNLSSSTLDKDGHTRISDVSAVDKDGHTQNSNILAVDDEGNKVEEVKIMEEKAGFEEILVWGHESVPDQTEDVYCRGVGEWIAWAGAIHSVDA